MQLHVLVLLVPDSALAKITVSDNCSIGKEALDDSAA